MMADSTPYSTAKKMLGRLPDYVGDEIERERVAAYALYEDIYWCVPDTFRITQRGSNADPIYLPSGRQIVETLNRFLCPDPAVITDPAFGSDTEKALANQVWADFSTREAFFSKFNTGKRYGLIRGDQVWHIWADPEREPGSKVSIYQLDPGSVFPIYEEDNIDVIIGYHVIEQFVNNMNKPFVSRQTYLKESGKGGPSRIIYSKAIYEVDDWGGPGMEDDPEVVTMVQAPIQLPEPIDSLPIYVIPNFDEPGAIWGSSEMRGMERIFAALNQAISDEELSLALEGLGVYWTDAGTPVDDDGNPVAWNLGPGRVVELSVGKKFGRVQGSSSFAPFQQHMEFLSKHGIDQTFGHSDVAKGNVDVATAESGVALMLELGPILARASEREIIINSVTHQMLFGLAKWYTAFEGNEFSSLFETTKWRMHYGSRVPSNFQQDFKNLITIAAANPQIVPMSWIREELQRIGFKLPEGVDIEALILKEVEGRTEASSDPDTPLTDPINEPRGNDRDADS